jgi:hypothetical protein
MKAIKLYLGLDVHKDSITIALAHEGRQGEIRLFGTITNDLHALEKALARIRKAHPGAHLEVAYEAGPCGFGIARRLHQLKVSCLVAAPSLIPKPPGSPFKTDLYGPYYDGKKAKGMVGQKAMMAVARKFLKLLWGLNRSAQSFAQGRVFCCASQFTQSTGRSLAQAA